MVDEEIFILTKHANFEASYAEKIPVYKRRYYLHLLQKENEEIERIQDQERSRINRPRR